MIRQLDISNFTQFPGSLLRFNKGLNVFVGENGSGKTHILKIIYTILSVSWEESRRGGNTNLPTKAVLQTKIADKLVGVFRPETLGRLARRVQGRSRCEVSIKFSDRHKNLSFGFSTSSKAEVSIDELPDEWVEDAPVYIPTRELMSIYPNFVSTYETRYLELEETWRDTCILLGSPLQRGPKEGRIRELLEPIEESMGGKITLEKNGRFYLRTDTGQMEMPLVAEGYRKLGMIARLIAAGVLADTGYLFWDEPEANLNPRLIKQVARTIFDLSRGGTQVFIATHSLFLLRELEILMLERKNDNRACKFFGLHATSLGTKIQSGSNIENIGDITSLDEELQQSDRFLMASSIDARV